MASKYIYLSGKAKWARVHKPDEKYHNFSVQLYLDKTSSKTYADSGLGLTVKEDEEGKYIKLRRPEAKLMKGEMVEFGPPKIIDKDNNPFDGAIGNGSDVTTKVVVYDTVKGPGHRLEAIRVDKLVEYHGSGGGDASAEMPF